MHFPVTTIVIAQANRKRGQIQNRQIELNELIKKHSEADHTFRDTITSLLTLANRGLQLFDEGNFERKRKLMNLLFSNLSLRGGKLEFSLQKPMDQFVNLTTCPEWWVIEDSNFRPLPCQGSALTN